MARNSLLSLLAPLLEEFQTSAQAVDAGHRSPLVNLKSLAAQGYYRLLVEADPGTRRRVLDHLSSACGVTAFVSTQHEGVCRRLTEAHHPLATQAIEGTLWCGVCFAHLRRANCPVDVMEFRDYVLFSGSGPWFTGHGMMTSVLIGGVTPQGRYLMGLSPVDCPEILATPMPPLAVMDSSATVGLVFNAVRVDKSEVLVDVTPQEFAEKDMHSTVFQSARSLGAARAAARFLSAETQKAVEEKLEVLHRQMDQWDQSPNWQSATELRKEALVFCGKVIQAAYVEVGGKAHLATHPLQRLSREANFYTTTQLTVPLRTSLTGELVK